MEIVDFDPLKDTLILPFLSTDSVDITLEGTSIYATLESGLRDKLYQLNEVPLESSIALQTQLTSKWLNHRSIYV